MTAVASHVTRARRLRVGVAADTIALGVLLLGVVALVALTWQTWGNPGRDTGYDLVAGARVAHGDLPYLDFVYYYGPLAPLSVGLFAWIGGGVLGSAIALGIVLATAAVLLTYGIARVFATPAVSLLAALTAAAAAFAPTNYSFVMPHTFAAPLGIVGLLGMAFAGARYSQGGARPMLILAGLSLAVVLLSRPEFALAGLAGAAVWLVARRRSGAARRHEVWLFALPALGLPLAVYGAFAAATSPHALVFDNLYPRAQMQAGANDVLKLHAPMTVSSFVDLAGKTLLYALGAGFLVAAGRLAVRRNVRIVLALCGVLVIAVALDRSEATRHGLEYVYGWIPAGAAAAAVFYGVWALRGRVSGVVAEASVLVAVPLALLAAKEYASFQMDAPHPQPAVYALPLAAVFLVALHMRLAGDNVWARRAAVVWLAFVAAATAGLALKDARAESVVVHGPGGSIRAATADGAVFERTVAAVTAHSQPGAPVLVAPQLTWLYALADRSDPLPQLSLLPSALPTVDAQQKVISELDAARVKLAVIDMRQFPEYGHTFFGGSFDRVLAAWLHQNFHRVAAITAPGSSHVIVIWERSGP
jgi:hypothetical protein